MCRFPLALVAGALVLAALLAFTAHALTGPDPSAALAVFDARRAVLAPALTLVPLVLLALGVWDAGWRGRPAALRLWGPFVLYVFATAAAWFGVDEAAFGFARAHGLWQGGFSGALIYALLFWPGALVCGLAATGVVSFLRRRRAG